MTPDSQLARLAANLLALSRIDGSGATRRTPTSPAGPNAEAVMYERELRTKVSANFARVRVMNFERVHAARQYGSKTYGSGLARLKPVQPDRPIKGFFEVSRRGC